MTEEEVCAAVDAELGAARILRDGKIGSERALAYRYYFGEPFGNEEDGKSKIVSQLVMEIIDSLMPDLMRIFAGGERAVEFVARKEEDVPLAEQATEVCNYVLFTQNSGFLVLYSAIKDALMQKTGAIKYWWEKERKIVQETYMALSEGQILILKQDPEVDIVAATPRQDIIVVGPDGQPVPVFDVTVKRKKESGHICIEAMPPEELLISSRANTVDTQKLPFVAHETTKTRSELVEMGYELKAVMDLPAGEETSATINQAASARQERTEGMGGVTGSDSPSSDPMQQTVLYVEAHQYLDADGDGISELRRICKVGSTILSNEPTERVNIAVITPKIMPHEFHGVSLADDSMDLQLLKSTLWRMMLDNLYLTNYPRQQVVETMMSANTYADLMAPGPGRPVRVKAQGARTPLEVPFVAGASFPMMEFIEQEVEGRTPVTRNYQGVPDDVLNKTATQQKHETGRSQGRVELIARTFAETGIRDLFRGLLWLLGKYQQESMIVRISGKYVPIDPRAWTTEYDMTCNVGLGVGSKAEQLQTMGMVAQAQQAAVQAGGMGLLVTPKNIYNLQTKIAQIAGMKDPNAYWTPPPENWQPPPPPPPEAVLVEQERQKGDAQKTQALSAEKIHLAQMQHDLERAKLDHAAQLQQIDKQNQLALQQSNDQRQSALDQQKAALEAEFKQREMDSKERIADRNNLTTLEVARIGAGVDDGTALAKAQAEAAGFGPLIDEMKQLVQHVASTNGPKRIVRDPSGRAVGVEPVTQ